MSKHRLRPVVSILALLILPGAGIVDVWPGAAAIAQSPGTDQIRAEAERIQAEAEALERQGTGDARRQAIARYEAALKLWSDADAPAEQGEVWHRLGRLHELLSAFADAIRAYEQALSFRRAVGNRKGEGGSLNNIGAMYYYVADYPRAIEYYERALPIRREVGDQDGEAYTLSGLGLVHASQGDSPKSLPFYDQAIALWRAVGNRSGEALGLHNLATSYGNLGDTQTALTNFGQALELRRSLGDRQGEAQTLSVMGTAWSAMGDEERALAAYGAALPLRRLVGDRRGEAYTLMNIASSDTQIGRNEEAIEQSTRALEILRALGDRNGQAYALRPLGRAHFNRGEYELAIAAYDEALGLSRAVGDRRLEASLLTGVGDARRSLGQFEVAHELYTTALTLERGIREMRIQAGTLFSLALLARDRGDLPEARRRVEEAVTLVESMRSTVVAPELRASFLASKQNAYEFYIDVLMALHARDTAGGFAAAALAANERRRARVLLETLAAARADIRQGVDPALLEREKQVGGQLNAKADRLTRLLTARPGAPETQQIEQELRALIAERAKVEESILTSSPAYAALTQPQPLTVDQIQRVLDPDTLLLEFALGERRSYVWAVTTGSVASFDLPARREIEALALRVRDLLTRSQRPDLQAQVKIAAERLSRMLLGPVYAQLKSRRLAIVADGALQYVPFAALPEPVTAADAGAKPVPLIVSHEIVTLPSASTIPALRRDAAARAGARDLLAVLADPVLDASDSRLDSVATRSSPSARREPGKATSTTPAVRPVEDAVREAGITDFKRLRYTRAEAEAVAALAGRSRTWKALDFDASRTTATDPALARYRIVHFATHALVNDDHPELSGVVLSLVDRQGDSQDGFLRLHDIYNLRLGADLVVLSACQTALGKNIEGEGLVGLTRGFMYAGARTVVASLWNVRDQATAELMKRFYAAMLQSHLRPAAALRRAQVSMLNDPRWNAPFYWAGFVIQGDWR